VNFSAVKFSRVRGISSALLALSLQPWASAIAQIEADNGPSSTLQPDAPAVGATEAPADMQTASPAPEIGAAAPPDADLATIPVGAEADASEDVGSRAKSGNRFVEEIVVTAQKREENVQTVPISITALSGALLEAKGIDDPIKLGDVTPGLTYNSSVGFSIIYIRGIGSDAFLTADPSVASYIDGIYYPFSSGQAQSFGKVERIEVLKGPQGTLFGRNSTGGAISVTTETPEQTFGGSYSSGYSSFDSWKNNLVLTGPIGDSFAASVAVLYNHSDQYYKYTDDSVQQDLPPEISKGVRAKLRWLPTDDFEATIGVTAIRQSGLNSALSPNTAPSPLGRLLGETAQPRNYTATIDGPVSFTIDSNVYTGEAKWTPGPLDIKLLGSHQTINNVGLTDFDGTNAPIITFSADPLYASVTTAELQFLSNKDSWASSWLESIGGFYFFKEQAGLDPRLTLLGGNTGGIQLIHSLPPIPVGQIVEALPGPLQAALGPLPLTHGVVARLAGQVDTQSEAIFTQNTAHVTDWLALTLGVRYQVERRSAAKSTFGLENTDGSVTQVFDFINGPGFQNGEHVAHTSFVSPKASVSITPYDGLLIYASAQRANKSGTFNIINIDNGVDYAKPERVTAFEAGVKSELFDGLVRLNGAIFQSDVKNLQVQFVSLLNGGAVSIENAKGARSRGAEFDTLIEILPDHIDGLVFTAGGAYVDAIYTDYKDGSGFNETTGLYQANEDFTGNSIVRSPKFSGNAALSKSTSFGWGSMEVAGDTSYNSGYSYLAQNSLFNEKKYQLVNGRVSFLYDAWKVRATVFGDNLTDKVHALSQFPNDFGRLEALAPPRTFGIRLDYTFGS
jgi:iron complex outermembrane receptor protein